MSRICLFFIFAAPLLVTSSAAAQNCIVTDNLQVTPPPSSGTYPPGTAVQFCYTISNYNNTNSNWLHAIIPLFGPGWDLTTLQSVGQPVSLDQDGTWLWINNVTGQNTGQFFPNYGWFYDSQSGGLLNGNPGDNYGDFGQGPWTFCWQISTLSGSSCVTGASLQVEITNYGDSESGSWTNLGCQNDPSYFFNASLVCCDATINVTNPTCSGANGSIYAQGLGPSPYDYVWTDGNNNVISQLFNINGPSTINNLAPGTYHLSVVDNDNCIYAETFVLTQPNEINAIATVNDSFICPGEVVQLNAYVQQSGSITCGLNTSGCQTNPTSHTVGSGTGTSLTPTPYEGYWHDGRMQILYLAAELTAAGLTAGSITEIAFHVSSKGSTIPYNNFTIKMGCTNLTALSTFTSVPDVVYGPVSYSTTVGWNTHALSIPWAWDGTSNVIVESCFDNTAYTSDDAVYYTNTSNNSVVYDYADLSTGCTLSGPTSSTMRPNTQFIHCPASTTGGGSFAYDWLPVGNISNAAIADPTAAPTATTTDFVVTISDSLGCHGSDTVTVNVDTLDVVAGPDTFLCAPGPVQLNASASGYLPPATLTCGTNATACGQTQVSTVGTGTTISGAPTPYEGYWHDSRVQMLFTAAELNAAGINSGTITAISFNVATLGSTQPYSNFTIRIGCTSLTELTGFTTAPSQVYGPTQVYTSLGWNTHTFTQPYDWDGSSNLVIEVCFDNTSYTDDDDVYASTTSFNSVVYYYADNNTGCNMTTAYSPVTSRPNVRFTFCDSPPSVFTYSWTPNQNLSANNIPNPVATPTGTTNYVVTTSNNHCTATDTVSINVATPSGPPGIWTWTGQQDSNWFNPCNWDKVALPPITNDVRIPGVTPFQPLIAADTAYCKTLTINATNGGKLSIDVNSGGKLIKSP